MGSCCSIFLVCAGVTLLWGRWIGKMLFKERFDGIAGFIWKGWIIVRSKYGSGDMIRKVVESKISKMKYLGPKRK